MTTHPASDIPRAGWLATWLPPGMLPYARLMRADRPIGTWLLLFPCWWGIALATPGLPSLWLIMAFAAGAFVMRGAGCTYNDIVDRDIDGRVARTADRPIPSGAVTPRQAMVFLAAQLAAGFAILILFNATTIALGVASLVLVFTYPLMKRVTWWPQFFLGLAFNWGALMGYAAAVDGLDAAPVLLYVGGIALVGIYVASAIYIALFMVFLGHYTWLRSVTVGLSVGLFAFVLFERWFHIPLPKGFLERALGY